MSDELLFRSHWNAELIQKYDVPVPRYTSYPTANLFDSTLREPGYRKHTARFRNSTDSLSIYVHVPFCRDICYYCACNKVVSRKLGIARKYLDHIRVELETLAPIYRHRPVSQLHWGGGTPTYLDSAELTELMHLVSSSFRLSNEPESEYAIEIDPRTMDSERLALLRGLGFNKVSFGIQDFDPEVQSAINRVQSHESVVSLVSTVRELGFNSLSFDLIYGLPNQTRRSLEATMDKVIDLLPDRIACYNYAHLPDRFPSQRSIARNRLPLADEKIAMLQYIGQRLTDAGYDFLGMDHFVLNQASSGAEPPQGVVEMHRNFQGYSTNLAKDIVGVGPSAISSVCGSYWQNQRDLDSYYDSLDSGALPIDRGLIMSEEDKLRNEVIMGIACNLKLDFADVEQRHGIDFRAHFQTELNLLRPLEMDGLVVASANGIQVTDLGRLLLRNICSVFDAYLPHENNGRGFSKAI